MDALFADGLCIRPFRMRDAEAFACAVRESVDTVGRWLPWCRADYSRKDARAWIAHCAVRLEMRVSYDVGIFSEDGDTLYGGVAVNQIDTVHNMANIGYWVRASMQRQGGPPPGAPGGAA